MSELFFQQISQARIDLEEIRDTLALVKSEAAAFAPDDPEPYGADARVLHETLANAQRAWVDLAQRRRELLSQVPAPVEGALERLKAAVVRPFDRIRLSREVNGLSAGLLALGVQAAQARRLLEELHHKPLAVARRCRNLAGQAGSIEQLALALGQKGLYGPELEAVLDRAEQSLGELRQAPACFLAGTDAQVLAEATRDGAVAAWRAAGQVAVPLQEGLDTLSGWQATHDRFVRLLEANQALLGRVETAMQEAERARDYPVGWGAYRDRLVELHTLASTMGEPEAKRTAQQLAEQAGLAQRFGDTALALANDVDAVLSWRQRLLPMLQRAELIGQPAWLAQADSLIPELGRHPPGDWPSELGVQALPDDLGALRERLHQWVPAGPGARLPATLLEGQFAAVRDLLPEIEAFQARLDGVAHHLAALQVRQQEARQELGACGEALARLVERLRDAEPPLDGDLSRARRQVEDARQDCEQAAGYFEASTEPLEARLRYVERRYSVHRRALRTVLSAVQADQDRHRRALQAEVESLETLARLDQEPAMIAARQILLDAPAGGGRAPSRQASPVRLVGEVESHLQVRRDLVVALGTLRSQVSDPIAGLDRVFFEAQETALARYKSLMWEARAARTGTRPLAVDTAWAARLVEMARRDEGRLRRARTAQDARDALQSLVNVYRDLLAEVEVQEARLA